MTNLIDSSNFVWSSFQLTKQNAQLFPNQFCLQESKLRFHHCSLAAYCFKIERTKETTFCLFVCVCTNEREKKIDAVCLR